MIEYRNRQVDL